MKWIKKGIKSHPHLALSVPMLLSAFSFLSNLVASLSDGVIDSTELHTLLSSADAFESVLLIVIMVALKEKKK